MQNVYAVEMEYERDMERMKELYPQEAKRIQRLVEEECDKLEYEGSMMFDEYPDRVMLKVICDRIYQNALNAPETQEETEAEMGSEAQVQQLEALDYRRNPGPPPPPPGPWRPGPPPPGPWRPGPPPPPNNPGLGNLIEVLLYNEMYKRRCRHNRCRRWW